MVPLSSVASDPGFSRTALKYTFDALVYALLTACVFGWLWP